MTTPPPRRVTLSRASGWGMPENTTKVDRSTRWGNPYVVGAALDRRMAARWGFKITCDDHHATTSEDAAERFRTLLISDEGALLSVKAELAGRNLACWCAPGSACHADVLLELANQPAP